MLHDFVVAHAGYPGPRALVVGCGFIGSNLVEALAAAGEAPTVLTRSRPPAEVVLTIGDSNLRLGDASDADVVEAALEGVSRVFFCAGGLLPVASERDPETDRLLTVGPVETMLSALAGRPEIELTYLSSGGTVYGEPARIPVAEDDPTDPISAYGKLHLECELMIARARRDAALRARVLRCSTVYGEHQRPDRGQGAVVTFLHRIEHGDPIQLYGGGSTIRDYVYVGDVTRAMRETAALDGGPAVVNVGSGRGTSLVELLRLTEAQVGRPAKVIERERRGDVHQIVLDTDRLRGMIDFEPTPIETGIERTHRWLRASSGGEG